MADYTATIDCTVSQNQAYQAITQEMSEWWTPMSRMFLAPGDQAKTNFGGESYWIFEAITLDQPTLAELSCIESHMVADGVKDPKEWLGTTLKFELSTVENKTRIRFTHIGLNKNMECFDICKNGWDHFLLGSLTEYLNGRNGQPNSY